MQERKYKLMEANVGTREQQEPGAYRSLWQNRARRRIARHIRVAPEFDNDPRITGRVPYNRLHESREVVVMGSAGSIIDHGSFLPNWMSI